MTSRQIYICQASRCEQKNVDAKSHLIGLLCGLFSMTKAMLTVVNIEDIRNMYS